MRPRTATCLAAIAAIAWTAGAAGADEQPALVSRPALEWSLTVAGGALWLTETLLIAELAPSACRWCDSNALDDGARGLAWSDGEAARVPSDIISYGIAPLAAGGLLTLGALRDDRAGDLVTDLLIVAQAGVTAGVSGDLMRVVTGRERPWVHDLAPEDKAVTDRPEQKPVVHLGAHGDRVRAGGLERHGRDAPRPPGRPGHLDHRSHPGHHHRLPADRVRAALPDRRPRRCGRRRRHRPAGAVPPPPARVTIRGHRHGGAGQGRRADPGHPVTTPLT